MKNIFSILIVISIVNISCKTTELNSQVPYLKLTKERCLGKCPVYDLVMFESGKVVYIGIDNVSKKGKSIYKVSKRKQRKLEELLMNFEAINYEKKRIRDLPKTKVKYKNKEIVFQGNDIPENIKKAIAILEGLIFE